MRYTILAKPSRPSLSAVHFFGSHSRLWNMYKRGESVERVIDPQEKIYLSRIYYSFLKVNALPFAFILINTASGAEEKVIKKLLQIKGVEEVHTVYGTYDIIAKVKIDDAMEKLKEDLTWNIRRITEVQSTTTLIVAKSY
jgi:DNA-binding Lrp family transcriptional regulator